MILRVSPIGHASSASRTPSSPLPPILTLVGSAQVQERATKQAKEEVLRAKEERATMGYSAWKEKQLEALRVQQLEQSAHLRPSPPPHPLTSLTFFRGG